MIKLIILLLGFNYFLTYSQHKYYNMLLCIPNYNREINSNIFPYPQRLMPLQIFSDRTITNNLIYSEQNLISGLFFIFLEDSLTLQQSFEKGIIISPFVRDTFLVFLDKLEVKNLPKYYAKTFCKDYPFIIFDRTLKKTNVGGIHFSTNIFQDELKYILPYYPVGMTIIPVKLYGQLDLCSSQDIYIPNWKRLSYGEPKEIEIDSAPVYIISNYDSLFFYNNRNAISRNVPNYMKVYSQMDFLYSNHYVRMVKKHYQSKKDITAINKTIFHTSWKLKDYFNFD